MAACSTGQPKPVPSVGPKFDLYPYSKMFLVKLHDEMQVVDGGPIALPPCARDVVVTPCSALRRYATDYVHVRDQQRASGQVPK